MMATITTRPAARDLRPAAAIITFFLFTFAFCILAHAADSAKTRKQTPDLSEKRTTSQSPINITADRMEANQDERTIIFESHVVVKQDDLTITSNRLKVVLLPEDSKPVPDDSTRKRGGHGEKTIVRVNNKPVPDDPARERAGHGEKTIVQEENKPASEDPASAQRIDYIEFEGDVKVTQQDRVATANKAIFYQKEQKIVMHGRPVVTKGQDRVVGDLITIFLKEGRSVAEGQVTVNLLPGKKE